MTEKQQAGSLDMDMTHKILAIDDEAYVRQSVRTYLEDYSFVIIEAENGHQGMELFDREAPDLVLLDLRMPSMDGFHVLSALRARNSDIPVVVASGTGEISDVVKALHLGASDYILKPIRDMKVLLHSVRKCLKQSWLKRQNVAYQERLEELVRERTEELEESRKRYKAIFEYIGVAAVIVESDGTISRANPAFAQLMGIDRSAIEHRRKWCEFVDPRDVGPMRNFMFNRRLLEMEGPVPMQYETRFVNDDGQVKYVYVCLGVIPGRPEQQIISLLDVTERKRAEKRWKNLELQLRKSQKMEAIGTLAGGIAHDLNNILSPVLGYADMIMRTTENGSDNYHRSEKIQMAAMRAADLVSQILSFNRGGAEKKQAIRLHPLAKEVIKLLKGSIPSTIRIKDEVMRDTLPVMAEPTQIHQVVMNLCTNAYHAMEATGGTLSVGLRKTVLTQADLLDHPNLCNGPGVYMVIEVSDTGCGMADDIRDRIFDPYFTTKEEGKGTGLGLATVYSITRDCRGDVRVASTPGKGSCFSVYLPAVVPGREEEKTAPLASADNTGSGERILVVDDDHDIALMCKEGLELLGYDAHVFFSSTEALDFFHGNMDRVDLVILDQTMPGITGFELAKKMMALRPDLPVILCSGYSATITKEMIKSVGIRRFFMKPVTVDSLSAAIQKILKPTEVLVEG